MSPIEIRKLKAQGSGSLESLRMLGRSNDPFDATHKTRARNAEWAADLFYQNYGDVKHPVHVRDIHYAQEGKQVPWSEKGSNIYSGINDSLLKNAFRDARLLGLIPFSRIIDQKNPDADVADNWNKPAGLEYRQTVGQGWDVQIEKPAYECGWKGHTKPYLIEVWTEKYTHLLKELQDEYEFNIQFLGGDPSLTRSHQLARRIIQSERPTRIFFLSDFNVKGYKIPNTTAVHLAYFFLSRPDLIPEIASGIYEMPEDLDVQLERIMITWEQVKQFELKPVAKDSKRAKDGKPEFADWMAWRDKYGGQVELNAFSGPYPQTFKEVIRTALNPYTIDIDPNKPEKQLFSNADWNLMKDWEKKETPDKAQDIEDMIDEINDDKKKEYDELVEAMEKELDDQTIEVDFDADARLDDPLYDSRRDYFEQVEVFKRKQDQC